MTTETRRLTLLDATMLVMGGIIGVGIFFKPHGVAQLVPEPAAFFGMWGLGALAALAGAMTFAELAGTFPRTGGWYVFLREGIGSLAAFLFAWVVLLVVSTGACAAVAEFGAQRIEVLLGFEDDDPLRRRLLAGGLIVGITLLGMAGLKAGAVLQNLCMLAKLLVIAVVVFVGLLLFTEPALQAVPAVLPTAPLPRRMISAALPVLFTYGGWQLLTYVAPHVENPARNLPRAIVWGVAGVGVVYLALNAAFVRVLGMGGLADLPDVAAVLAERTLGVHGALVLEAAMAISAIGFLVATLIATPGVYVAMARERLFLRAVGRTHPRTGAPMVALGIQALVTLAYLVLSGDVRNELGDAVVFAEWIFHALVGYALLRLRHTRPELERPFRSPLYPLFPLVYTLLAVGVVLGNLFTSPGRITMLGLGVLAIGAVVYVPWKRLDRPQAG
ncbi:MAG: APA family basic amino acid/polyamine antiporter [Chlamydiales bacterium]